MANFEVNSILCFVRNFSNGKLNGYEVRYLAKRQNVGEKQKKDMKINLWKLKNI
jgi:hypothetical protein